MAINIQAKLILNQKRLIKITRQYKAVEDLNIQQISIICSIESLSVCLYLTEICPLILKEIDVYFGTNADDDRRMNSTSSHCWIQDKRRVNFPASAKCFLILEVWQRTGTSKCVCVCELFQGWWWGVALKL